MIKKYESKIFYTLLSLTVLTISFIVYRYINGKVDNNKYEYIYTNEPFDMKEFTKNGYAYIENSMTKDKKYTALFITTSTGCTACIGQFQIYDRFINESGLIKVVNRVLAVVDSNKNRATWFARVSNLQMNSISKISLDMEKLLVNYEGEKYEKQIAIVNNLSNKIVMRIKIAAGISVTYAEIKEKLPVALGKIGMQFYYTTKNEKTNRRGEG